MKFLCFGMSQQFFFYLFYVFHCIKITDIYYSCTWSKNKQHTNFTTMYIHFSRKNSEKAKHENRINSNENYNKTWLICFLCEGEGGKVFPGFWNICRNFLCCSFNQWLKSRHFDVVLCCWGVWWLLFIAKGL